MRDFWTRAWRWEPLRRGVVLYLALRAALSLWAVLVLAVAPAETGPSDPLRPYLGIEPVTKGVAGLLLGPWQRFDTLHYIRLAKEGYQPESPSSILPPFYPLLIRGVGGLLGGSDAGYLGSALLISNAACLGYLVIFLVLARTEVAEETARRAQVYVALYPWAFALVAGYTEPLSLLLVASALLASRRGCGWLAGLCGALAALTRFSGVLLVFPLLLDVLLRRSDGRLWPPRLRWLLTLDIVWAVLPGLAAIGFQFWRGTNGLPPAAEVYATRWHHRLALPWEGFVNAARLFYSGDAHFTDYLDFTAGLIFVGLAAVSWLRLSPTSALYMTVVLLFNVAHVRTPHPMCSVGRHTIELFPAFLILAQVGECRPWLNRLILYPSVALLLWLSGQFVLWGWVG